MSDVKTKYENFPDAMWSKTKEKVITHRKCHCLSERNPLCCQKSILLLCSSVNEPLLFANYLWL